MFCPNCGKDCGEGRFCASCGTQLRRDAEPQKQQNQDVPNRINTKKGSTDIPTSSGFLGRYDAVLLYDSAVSISTGSGGSKKRTKIPFDQLVTVIYMRPASNGWRDGGLLLRGEVNKDVPIDTRHMSIDDAAVTFSLEKDTLFYHIYQLLKAVAPPTAKFEMIIPESKIKKLDEMARGIDFESLWNKFAPFRERAADEIREKHRIKREAARVLVDRAFDARQKLRYDTDPLDAIRDLNQILDTKRKEENNIKRLRDEIKSQREHREIKEALDTIALIKLREMRDD